MLRNSLTKLNEYKCLENWSVFELRSNCELFDLNLVVKKMCKNLDQISFDLNHSINNRVAMFWIVLGAIPWYYNSNLSTLYRMYFVLTSIDELW